MKAERLFQIIGLVDEDLIEEAAQPPQRRPAAWRKWATTAACGAVILLGGFYLTVLTTFRGCGSSAPAAGGNMTTGEAAGESGADGAAPEASAFLSYAGPVLPLTLTEAVPGLEADRSVTWDLTPNGEGNLWGAAVADRYTLSNTTEHSLSVTALYPFAGSFYTLSRTLPSLTVDGQTAESVLYAGEGEADSWQDYAALLDGSGQTDALAVPPELEQPVTVYEFTDLKAPESGAWEPTLAVSFTAGEASTVLSAGFNGCTHDADTGWFQYSVFLPDGSWSRTNSSIYLLVLGEDLEEYTLQGYQDGSCTPGMELENVEFSVKRRETTLSQALQEVIPVLLSGENSSNWNFPEETVPLVTGLLEKQLAREDTPGQALSEELAGSLDEWLYSLLGRGRIFYLAVELTIPAGGSIQMSAALEKAPSYDFPGAGALENQGIQGYDLLTQSGSVLPFRTVTAAIVHGEQAELVRQNLGFSSGEESGPRAIDPSLPHYYLELRPLE